MKICKTCTRNRSWSGSNLKKKKALKSKARSVGYHCYRNSTNSMANSIATWRNSRTYILPRWLRTWERRTLRWKRCSRIPNLLIALQMLSTKRWTYWKKSLKVSSERLFRTSRLLKINTTITQWNWNCFFLRWISNILIQKSFTTASPSSIQYWRLCSRLHKKKWTSKVQDTTNFWRPSQNSSWHWLLRMRKQPIQNH